MEAMKALKELRSGLESLGTAQIITGAELLSRDAAAAAADAYNPDFAMLDGLGSYQDAFARPNTANSYQNVVISIDPSAAAYGISAAVVANAANGNSNNFQRTGTGF